MCLDHVRQQWNYVGRGSSCLWKQSWRPDERLRHRTHSSWPSGSQAELHTPNRVASFLFSPIIRWAYTGMCNFKNNLWWNRITFLSSVPPIIRALTRHQGNEYTQQARVYCISGRKGHACSSIFNQYYVEQMAECPLKLRPVWKQLWPCPLIPSLVPSLMLDCHLCRDDKYEVLCPNRKCKSVCEWQRK